MSFEIGSRIFDYEITGVLGAGGMGKVYKVRNVISDRTDAMKVLLPDLANQPELADRFLREIKVLASLTHPNIAAFHTALRFENQLIMIMEYVNGTALSERLSKGPIPLSEGLKYLDQVLAALSYAHHQGVIHRDIKPANMMLTPEGNIKLMDFGIAKAATDPQLTRTGTTVGSLFYISPEQLTGAGMDARSDLYSLGVAMYEIVTGKRPFEGKSEYSLMAAHLQEAPRPPSELNPHLSPALNSIILMALAKNPADRFQTADAFRTALNEATKNVEIKPSIPSVPQEAPPPVLQPATQLAAQKNHRGTYMLLGALIAIILIVASAVELPKWFRARALTRGAAPASAGSVSPSPAPAPAAGNANPAPSSQAPVSGNTPAAAQAPPPSLPGTHKVSGSVNARGEVNRPVTQPAPVIARRSARSDAASHNETVNPQPAAPGNSQPVAATPSIQTPAAQDAAALQALGDRRDQLSGRANAVKTSILNLQQQIASTGQSLRPDVLASESRMERYMDEVDSAFSAHNPALAGRYMDLAEREIENLESFLGR